MEPVEVASTCDFGLTENVTDDVDDSAAAAVIDEEDSYSEPLTNSSDEIAPKKAKKARLVDASTKQGTRRAQNCSQKNEIVKIIEKSLEQKNQQETQCFEAILKIENEKLEVMTGLLGVLNTLVQGNSTDK